MADRYFRFRWDETRGDDFDAWGTAVYLFASDTAGIVDQQFEIYEDGHVLAYDAQHSADQFGQLTDQPLNLDDLAGCEISAAEFHREIAGLSPSNR